MKLSADTKETKKMLPQIIYTGCCCFLLALYIFFTLQKGYFIFAYGTPRELREMTGIAVARQFAYGRNPYALPALENNIPVVTSIYGLLVPLLMSPFIRLLSITPLSALQICQLLTLIVEVTGAVFFYHLLFMKTKNRLLSLIGMLVFQTCYWRYSSFGGAFPDQWGVTVSVILMTLLCIDERRERYRPLLYVVIMVSLFYIKQYFILILIGLCIYLLFRSKKDFIKMIFYGILTGCLSVVMIYTLFPLYFPEVFPIAQGQTLTGDSAYSAAQIAKLSLFYFPVVLFAISGMLYHIYRMISRRQLRSELTYEFCQIVFIFPFLFRIAENQGTNYTYYLQLWYPYIILFGLVSASELLKCFSSSAAQISTHLPQTLLSKAGFASIYFLLTFSLIKILPSCLCPPLTQEQQKAWHDAYHMLDSYASEGDILVTMLLSDYCLEQGIETSNYGQAEYNNLHNLDNYKNNKLWRNIFLFHYTDELLQQNISYNQTVKDNISRQSYHCIALVYAGEYHLAEDDIINAGYHAAAAKELQTGSQCWHTTFYTLPD